MSAPPVPGAWQATTVLAGVALRRLLRSKTPWIVAALAGVPVLAAGVGAFSADVTRAWQEAFRLLVNFMVAVAPLLVAAPVSEEIEDRTYTYLWSRPLPRWTMLVGKILAGWPVAALVIGLATVACFRLTGGEDGDAMLRAVLAAVVGTLAFGLASAGIAALGPQFAQRLTYVYLIVDLVVGELPGSLHDLSLTHHVRMLGTPVPGDAPLGDALWCLALGGCWLAIGLVRLGRAEYAADR